MEKYNIDLTGAMVARYQRVVQKINFTLMRILMLVCLIISFPGFGQKPGIRPGLKLPYFVRQTQVTQDTSVINASGLVVHKLYDSRATPVIRWGMLLLNGVKLCDQNGLSLHISQVRLTLKPDGIEIDHNPADSCAGPLPVTGFTTNREAREQKNGDIEVVYIQEKKRYDTESGQMVINRNQMRCDDTGSNPVRITLKGKSLFFKDIGNVAFFEADIDRDSKQEIYLLDYATCSEQLKIYKISRKQE